MIKNKIKKNKNETPQRFCWKSTALLLSFGILVIVFTLYSSHSAVVARDMESASPQEQKQESWQDLLDPRLPDSPAYIFSRGVERLELDGWQGQERAEECLDRSIKRQSASQYAYQKNYTRRAVTTLHKSYGYLQEAAQSWESEDRSSLISQAISLADLIDKWKQEELHPSQKDSLRRLEAQLYSLRQQYHL